MAENDKPILDLSTLVPERPKIRIDGELYELAVMDDLGIRAQQWIVSHTNALQPFFERDELNEQEEADIEFAVREYVKRVAPGVPEEIVAKLSVWSCFRLVMFYVDHQMGNFLLAPVAMTEV